MGKSIEHMTTEEVEYTAHRLAQESLDWGEPIPDFSTRFHGVLEQCLAAPKYTFDKKELYKGINLKASILFYVMIKNHPFQNGNKRIAVITLLYFLYKNDMWLTVDQKELYNFAKWIAESNPKLKDPTLAAIHEFLRQHIRDLDIRSL